MIAVVCCAGSAIPTTVKLGHCLVRKSARGFLNTLRLAISGFLDVTTLLERLVVPWRINNGTRSAMTKTRIVRKLAKLLMKSRQMIPSM